MTDITMPMEKLQALFDMATGSMDFGSGFLEDEDVDLLREVAGILGVDPLVGTPANYVCRFTGKHNWYAGGNRETARCASCRLETHDPAIVAEAWEQHDDYWKAAQIDMQARRGYQVTFGSPVNARPLIEPQLRLLQEAVWDFGRKYEWEDPQPVFEDDRWWAVDLADTTGNRRLPIEPR